MRNCAIKADSRERIRFFCVLILASLSQMAWANPYEQVEQWQRRGVYELALKELDKKQPAAAVDYAQWERGERLRVRLYQSLYRWKAVLEHDATLPANASGDFRLWSRIQTVHAHLALKDSVTALGLVRDGIWSSADELSLLAWRAALVQVYVEMEEAGTAAIAWRRLRQDALRLEAEQSNLPELARDEIAKARRAYALSLIRQERYQEAVREVADDSSHDGRLLFAAGQLLITGGTSEQVYELSSRIVETELASPEQRRRAYILMSRAASRQKRYAEAVEALVNALLIAAPSVDHVLFNANADSLWLAYESWGLSTGLSQGLSPDSENAWAAALKTKRPAAETVAMASVLVLTGRSPQNRQQAMTVLLEALPRLEHGAEQALWLLNNSARLQQSYVDMPAATQRAALRAALYLADMEVVRGYRERQGPVQNPLTDQANGILDVHARLLLGEPGPAVNFVSAGLENLGAWFRSTQLDLLVLLRDLDAAGYHAEVATAAEKLAMLSSEKDIRIEAAERASGALLTQKRYGQAATLALHFLLETTDIEGSDLALHAYEGLWRAGLRQDAEQLWHRVLSRDELVDKAADLRRRLQLPAD